MIKFVSVIFILTVFTEAVFALSPDEENLKALEKKIELSVDKCINKTEIKGEDYRKIIMAETPLNGEIGCFLNCIAKELDLYKDKNILDKDKINKFLEPATKVFKDNEDGAARFANVIKVIDDCLATQEGGDDACAAAKIFGECAITNLKKTGFYH